jgi:membrane protein DedA with SNARE-associated domain
MLEILNNLFLDYGLLGLFVSMFLNMVIFSPPSEIILPAAGLFAYTTGVSLVWVILIATVANMFGNYFWYFIGRIMGYDRFFKIKWLKNKINKNAIDIIAEKFRNKEAYWVGILRFFPGVRAIIAIPAGMVKMPHKYFLSYSLIGIFLWACFWVLSGYFLGASFFKYKLYVTVFLLIALLLVVFIIYRKMIGYLRRQKILF